MSALDRIDPSRWFRTGLVLVLLAMFSYVVITAGGFRLGARLFPQYVGTAGIALCLLELARQAFTRGRAALRHRDEPSTADLTVDAQEQTLAGWGRAATLFLWIGLYYALIFLVGFTLATIVFVPALLTIRFRAGILPSAAIVMGLVALILALQTFLRLRVPTGILPVPF